MTCKSQGLMKKEGEREERGKGDVYHTLNGVRIERCRIVVWKLDEMELQDAIS